MEGRSFLELVRALSDRFYGYRRIAKQLKREGLVVNSKRVRRLMQIRDLPRLRQIEGSLKDRGAVS